MTLSDMSKCEWCELELDEHSRESIRLSNTQPPWQFRMRRQRTLAGDIAAAGNAFATAIKAATLADVEPPVTLWFHRACWQDFLELLRGSRRGE